jgi:predicted dehydrogenase
MKILFFGLGSIGKKHAKLVAENFDFELYAYRSKLGQEKNMDLNINEIYDLKKALDINPDLAFITNPTYLHIETALQCATRGIDLFIEKPLSDSLKGIEKLKNIVKRKNLFVYVGLCMRFHPVIEELKRIIKNGRDVIYTNTFITSYFPNWRPNQDYRKSYSADSQKGGGILLELIHELDYNYWLFGDIKKIEGKFGKISNLEINCEDIGEMLIEYKNGIWGSIHLNCFSFNAERIIKIYCEDKYIEGDMINTYIKIIDKNGRTELKKFELREDEIYKKQLDYFFECYKNRKKPMNDLEESTKVLKYLLNFKSKQNAI